MDVIRHHDSQKAIPHLAFVVTSNGIEDGGSDIRLAEMVLSSGRGADREEVAGIGRDPIGSLMVQVLVKPDHNPILRRWDSGGYH